jgi:hypothetical protein
MHRGRRARRSVPTPFGGKICANAQIFLLHWTPLRSPSSRSTTRRLPPRSLSLTITRVARPRAAPAGALGQSPATRAGRLAKAGTELHSRSCPMIPHRHQLSVKRHCVQFSDPDFSQLNVRQARLRPECAWRYPGFDRRRWYLAATIAEAIGGRPPSRHFEFRGCGPDREAGARTRSSDRGARPSV